MKFKELAVGTVFEFDRTGLPLCHGLKHGPWVKISARKYILNTNPFSTDDLERWKHQANHELEYQVGTINVKVIEEV